MPSYEEIRAEHLAHLRMLAPIKAEVERVIAASSIGDEYPQSHVPVTPEELGAAFDAEHAWREKLLDIYRRESAARAAERG